MIFARFYTYFVAFWHTYADFITFYLRLHQNDPIMIQIKSTTSFEVFSFWITTLDFKRTYFMRNGSYCVSDLFWPLVTSNQSLILKISYAYSKGIGPKVWYPQNQHDSLNQFQFFELKIRRNKKVTAILSPGIQPTYSEEFFSGSYLGLCWEWKFLWWTFKADAGDKNVSRCQKDVAPKSDC